MWLLRGEEKDEGTRVGKKNLRRRAHAEAGGRRLRWESGSFQRSCEISLNAGTNHDGVGVGVGGCMEAQRHVWTQPSAAPKWALLTWRFWPGHEKSSPPPQPDGAASFDRSHRQPTNSSGWSWPGVRSPPSLAWGPSEADSLAREEPRRSQWESFNSF